MAELFSNEWINRLKDLWNETPEVSDKLAEINFNATIACGYKDEEKPACVFLQRMVKLYLLVYINDEALLRIWEYESNKRRNLGKKWG